MIASELGKVVHIVTINATKVSLEILYNSPNNHVWLFGWSLFLTLAHNTAQSFARNFKDGYLLSFIAILCKQVSWLDHRL